jgi:hypothetical protein
MAWIIHRLRIPASETQMALVLALCSVAMSLMLWVILWQSDVIAQQGSVIRWLRDTKFGS